MSDSLPRIRPQMLSITRHFVLPLSLVLLLMNGFTQTREVQTTLPHTSRQAAFHKVEIPGSDGIRVEAVSVLAITVYEILPENSNVMSWEKGKNILSLRQRAGVTSVNGQFPTDRPQFVYRL